MIPRWIHSRWWLTAVAFVIVAAPDAVTAQTPKPKPKPDVRRSESPKKGDQADSAATLLIDVDVSCDVKVDGRAVGRVNPGNPVSVGVGLGQRLVYAAVPDTSAEWKQIVEVKERGQQVVSVELKKQLAPPAAPPPPTPTPAAAAPTQPAASAPSSRQRDAAPVVSVPPISAPSATPAPANYRVRFETTRGTFVVEVTRAWAPNAADRFYDLVQRGFYDGTRFYRVEPGFVVQWGISGDPIVNREWNGKPFADEPNATSNQRGTIVFAKSSRPNSATTQVFVNLMDARFLDNKNYAPFGRVVKGLDVLESLKSTKGTSIATQQAQFNAEGNAFLDRQFPGLDAVTKASIVGEK